MNHGKKLRLFLPDGTPSGPRYYELVNWTGQAVVMPVSRIKELVSGDWPEFERPGGYLVRGESEEGHGRLYSGESENVAKRVQGQGNCKCQRNGFLTVTPWMLCPSAKSSEMSSAHFAAAALAMMRPSQNEMVLRIEQSTPSSMISGVT